MSKNLTMPSLTTTMDRTGHLDSQNMQLEWLELAGRTLDRHVISDSSVPSFIQITGVEAQNSATVSGLDDLDYQNLASLVNHPTLSQLRTVNKAPLPPEVMEHFAHMQCHCLMGLFPEISRAWLTIDSDIYVWSFEHGSDVAYFDGLGETIVSVGLIKPKAGVFQNFVKYLLILTTTVEIVGLGVTFTSNSNNGPLGSVEEMHLVPEPVFVLPTDGVSMMVIKATTLGRIFMGGKDGCLYEITYQAQLGWFGKHCKKVNHSTGALSFLVPSFLNVALYDEDPIVKIEIDNSRHILYTLSQKGSVEIYDLGQNGDTLRKINKLSQSKIVHLATDVVKTLEASHFRPIVSISAIENNESEFLNMVAVTQGGVRLYFTAGCICLTPNAPSTTQRPCCLNLLHVRLPPGFAANASVLKPKHVHTAAYENGTLLLISSAAQDSELLWCLSSSAFPRPIASTLVEAHTLLALDGPAWALRRIADDERKDLSPALLKKKASSINQSVRWVILTASGAHIVQQLGPAELLRLLLLECRGPDSPQVKAFFQMQYPEQACASALLLACGEAGEAAAEWATRAFFLYGGQPALVPAHMPVQGQLYLGSNRFSPRQMSTPMTGRTAANVHQSLQAAVQPSSGSQLQFPTSPNRNTPYSPSSPTTTFSPQHMPYHNMNQSQFGQPNISQPQYQATLNQSQFNPNQFGSPNLNQSQFTLSNLNPSHIVPNPNQSHMGPNFTLGSPMPFNQSVFGNVMQQQQQGADLANYEIHFSAKHNGLYIYVGRILKPIWQMKCVTNTHGIQEIKEFLSSTITGADCSHILQQLYGVRNFLEKNSLGSVNTVQRGKPGQSADAAINRQLEVHYEEKHSLDALKVFIGISCEMLSLWKILCEHQFHVVAASLPPEQQSALQAASFRELLVGGQEVASLLIMSLINQYLTDNASVDSISDKLREVCPNLYRSEDAACSKANEILLFAKQQKSTVEREEMLRNALKLCKDVAPNVNLPLVCAKFVSAGFYSGVVDLCVACASKIDPQNIALHYYKSDQPSHDHDGYLAYFRRMDIYREVSCALERLYERSIAGPQSCGGAPDPPSTPPRATASDVTGSLSPADANYQARKVVSDCLTYSDELLHVSVYEWMLSKRLHGELLALAPARSLRDYLVRAARAAASPQLHDLLWKFYERNGEHVAAATVLEGLATRPGGGLTLAQRAAYLWQGVVCVRGGGAGGELLRRLEEAGEVARLQARVLDGLSALEPPPPPHLLQRLHDQLLDVSVLYEEYAEAYNLWECKLAIVHCSGHNDALLVEGIWSRILVGAESAAREASTPDERMGAVLSKVSALAREYVNSGHCFPLVFIVRQLEIMCCKLRADPGLVSKALLEVGVSIDQLLDVYIKLIGMNERVWMSEGNELHLLEAAALLMEHFTRDKVPFNAQVKRRVMVKCQDLISSSFNTLYTKPDTQELVKVLRGIQSKLDRME